MSTQSSGEETVPPAPEPAEDADPAETEDAGAVGGPAYLGEPGPPLDHRAPFYLGFVGAAGALVAYWLLTNIEAIGSTLILIVVALFLAAGLNPGGVVLRAARAAAELRGPRWSSSACSSRWCCSSWPSCR